MVSLLFFLLFPSIFHKRVRFFFPDFPSTIFSMCLYVRSFRFPQPAMVPLPREYLNLPHYFYLSSVSIFTHVLLYSWSKLEFLFFHPISPQKVPHICTPETDFSFSFKMLFFHGLMIPFLPHQNDSCEKMCVFVARFSIFFTFNVLLVVSYSHQWNFEMCSLSPFHMGHYSLLITFG